MLSTVFTRVLYHGLEYECVFRAVRRTRRLARCSVDISVQPTHQQLSPRTRSLPRQLNQRPVRSRLMSVR